MRPTNITITPVESICLDHLIVVGSIPSGEHFCGIDGSNVPMTSQLHDPKGMKMSVRSKE